MVLAEKGNDNARNGRRSRGPSPNGHVAAESTSEDESVPVDKIRVGRDYQAICPPLQPIETRRPDTLQDRALLVWSPTVDIPENKLDEYITLAKEKYGYNGEQALGMLFWHKHDLERAVLDLANFTPFPDEWSVEDKVLFEQAFQFHGKSFHRIRQMLPDKSIASLVKYYYSWKKTRTRTSLMDKQARKLTTTRSDEAASEGGSEGGGSNEESDADEKKWTIHRGIRRKSGSPPHAGGQAADVDYSNQGEGGTCGNCGVACSLTHLSTKGQQLCHSCYQHWRRTGVARPTSGPGTGGRRGGVGSVMRHKRRPPRGMYINHDDLVAMAASPHGQLMLRAMDREIISLKRQVQHNKQTISTLKKKTSEGIQDLLPEGDLSSRINARWTQDELLLAVQGVRKYGKDFKTIAEVIGTKTEAHLRSFFTNYRKRYNLDDIVKEYEMEHGVVVNSNVSSGDNSLSSSANSTTTTTTTTNTTATPATAGDGVEKMEVDENKMNNGLNNSGSTATSEPMDTTETSSNTTVASSGNNSSDTATSAAINATSTKSSTAVKSVANNELPQK